MPVDPFGTGLHPDAYNADYSYYGDDIPTWQDLVMQAISQGATTAQIIGAGYPPGSTVIYSPQYPSGQVIQAPPPTPLPYPLPPGAMPAPSPSPGGGVNLSNTTLMLLVGGVLLFMLGTKRGR